MRRGRPEVDLTLLFIRQRGCEPNERLDDVLHGTHPTLKPIRLISRGGLDEFSNESDEGRDDLTDAMLHGRVSPSRSEDEGLCTLNGC